MRAILMLVTLCAAGCATLTARPGPANTSAARGERVYRLYCSTCHGDRGDGNGPTGRRYGPPYPRDFTTGVFRFRSTASGQLPLHRDLVRTITRGMPGSIMPAWGRVLPPSDVDAVATFIEGFSARFHDEPEARRAKVRIPHAPAASAGAVRRGRFIYLAMKCWECHGLGGEGDGHSVPTLVTDTREPIVPNDFTASIFKGGGSAHAIYRTMMTGLDGTPMPSYQDTLLVIREVEQNLSPLRSEISPQELAALRRFVARQSPASEFYALDEREQARRAEGWRWDLVAYVRSLGSRPHFWRRFLGLGEPGGAP
ncbi:MAG: c-type cytochrome [Deltaproteobacteria bacterium]|nr:c-type cytochrome [Deltaproteobacteria bacterium]